MIESAASLTAKAREAILCRDYEPAYHYLLAALREDDAFHSAYFLLSRIACDFNNLDKEIEMLKKAVFAASDNAEYQAHLARAYAVKGDVDLALKTLDETKDIPQQTALSFDTLGAAYNRLSLYRQAAYYFEKATQLEKNNPAIYFNLASTLKFCGNFDEARVAYETAIKLNPHYYKAHAALTSLGGVSAEHNHIERLKSLYSSIDKADDRLHIAHALSKELEALQEFERSFHYLEDAKQSKLAAWDYSVDEDLAIFDALKAYFEESKAAPSKALPSNPQMRPIFVVGMPRSGTTLVERLLSNHSQVATAGELTTFSSIIKSLLAIKSERLIDRNIIAASDRLPFAEVGFHYLQSTAHHYQDKLCLVDKLPLNGLYAGHIIRALPHAKVICLDRDLCDTAMSNYRQLFSFDEYTYGYSLSLDTALRYTQAFKSLETFWCNQFPAQFYSVNYERLVGNPEQEAKKLFEFCGLVFEPECLDIQLNKNPVATASSVQVRDPISTKSVNQWQHYSAPMKAALARIQQAKA